LIEPAVNGTKNVISTAIKCGVKRVVVTSSCASVVQNDAYANPENYMGKIWSDQDWNDSATVENSPYSCSKNTAEKAAWEFKEKIEIVTINPAFIMGPPLSTRTSPTSVQFMMGLLMGGMAQGVSGGCYGFVDVRDVADAHVRACTNAEAPGKRFLMTSTDGYDFLQAANFLLPKYSSWPLPKGFKEGVTVSYRPYYDISPSQDILGIQLRPLGITLNEMADDLVAKGMVKAPEPPAEQEAAEQTEEAKVEENEAEN